MTMLLPTFDLHQPQSLQELESLIREFPDFDVLAGGSDLLPNYKCGLNNKDHVISLQHIDELKEIKSHTIGATVTLSELENHAALKEKFPVISQAASKVASPLIRQQATLGGNLHLDTRCHFFNQSYFWRKSLGYCLKADGDLCHVVPKIKVDGKTVVNDRVCYATHSSDLAPVLMALGAEAEYVGPEGSRKFPLKDLYCHDGIRRFTKSPEEILVRLHLPEESASLKAGYKKLRPREAWDFPVLGVAIALKANEERVVESLTICVSAVDTYPLMMDGITNEWIGKTIDKESASELGEQVRQAIQPKLNVPMQPGYRKQMAGVFVRRVLGDLLELS